MTNEAQHKGHVMTDEEWEVHRNCDTAHRDHKWYWKIDITTGLPHPTAAVCAHCGKESNITRKDTAFFPDVRKLRLDSSAEASKLARD